MAAEDSLATALGEIRERHERARHPEDDDGKIYIAAAAVAVALGEAPGWTVRRSGVSVEVYEDGRGVPAWRVWVERGRGGHLIGDGEFGRSARDVPRLLAAVEAVLKDHQTGRVTVLGSLCERHENHRYFSITATEATDVRACPDCTATVYDSCTGCGPQVPVDRCPPRNAITCALLGEEKP